MNPAPDQSNPLVLFWDTWRWVIVLAAASTVAITIAIVLLVQTTQTSTPIEFIGGETLGAETETIGELFVDIEGAVVSPGVKKLEQGSRVEDALDAAGGFTENVSTEFVAKNLNRAQLLTDGMKIYIQTELEYETSHNLGGLSNTTQTSYNISDSINNQDGQVGPMININSASADELDTLPGVGPVTANKIISNRPYQTLDDLVNKKAVGPALFEKIKNSLAL